MYRCKDCKKEFLECITITERHGLSEPPFEKLPACPVCKSTAIVKNVPVHCRFCGRTIKNGNGEYCSKECKRSGELMWREEQKRINNYENSPLIRAVRDLEKYNKEHNTNYTYGYYVANILKAGK